MRLAILLPDLRGGGVERIRLVLAEEFARAGIEVEFVLMKARGELIEEARARYRVEALGAERLVQVPFKLTQYLKRKKPDALLAAMWPLSGMACVAARLSGFKGRLVVSEHVDFRLSPSLKRSERMLLKGCGPLIYAPAAKVIAVSHGVAESISDCARLAPSKIDVIHNPIRPMSDTPPDEADSALIDWWKQGRRLIAIGNLKAQKGFDLLLDAVAELPDARLLVLGEGGLRAELEAQASRLGIAERCRFAGFRADPFAYLRHAEAFVLSSRWEGFGNVVVEALAAGVPVVSFDCRSGPREILDDGRYGRLVPVGDVAALARAIVETLASDHDAARLKRRAADFLPAKAADRYAEALFARDGAR